MGLYHEFVLNMTRNKSHQAKKGSCLLLLPAQDEQEAHEPGEGAHFVVDVGEHLLAAGRAGGHPRGAAQLRVVAYKLVLAVTSRRGLNCESKKGASSVR